MQRFFYRILLSVWTILAVTVSSTLLIASYLPERKTTDDVRYDSQLIDLVAQDLAHYLDSAPEAALDIVVARHVLDFDKLMQIYIILPDGRDVTGRQLPEVVQNAYSKQPESNYISSQRRYKLSVQVENLNNHMVVGYQAGFQIGRALLKPGARLALLIIGLTVSIIVSYYLSRFVMRPVRELRLAGQQVARGDLSVRVAHTVGNRKDDIAQLARDFDDMSERVALVLDNQQRLMRDVSHELRSPLARIQALLSIAQQQNSDNRMLSRIEHELLNLDYLIGEILNLARVDGAVTLGQEAIDVRLLLSQIVDNASIEGEPEGKSARLEMLTDGIMMGDQRYLASAIENVVRNALFFTPEQSEIVIQCTEDHDQWLILVRDQGKGADKETLANLFTPFYQGLTSSKKIGGVGLAIAQSVIGKHNGEISARNHENGGLEVKILLPR